MAKVHTLAYSSKPNLTWPALTLFRSKLDSRSQVFPGTAIYVQSSSFGLPTLQRTIHVVDVEQKLLKFTCRKRGSPKILFSIKIPRSASSVGQGPVAWDPSGQLMYTFCGIMPWLYHVSQNTPPGPVMSPMQFFSGKERSRCTPTNFETLGLVVGRQPRHVGVTSSHSSTLVNQAGLGYWLLEL